LIIIPKTFEDISDWEYLAIPSSELEDPNMPGYCVARVPSRLRHKYAGLAKEVITNIEQQHLQSR